MRDLTTKHTKDTKQNHAGGDADRAMNSRWSFVHHLSVFFNLVKTVAVYEPNGTTRLARTEYQYDAGTLADTPNVVMHLESHNPYAPQYEEPCNCEYVYNEQGYEEYICYSTCLVPAYDPSTNYRGNVTQVTIYATPRR